MAANGGTAPPPSLSKSGRLLLSELAVADRRGLAPQTLSRPNSLAKSDGALVRFTIRKMVAAAVVATAGTRVWAVRLALGLRCDGALGRTCTDTGPGLSWRPLRWATRA